jgi:hypothetical protein
LSQSDSWRWADEQGEQRLVAADELRAAIAGGVLPASTLVWREGMSAWMPASSVPEFANLHAASPAGAGTNPPAPGPTKATLQGIAAREIYSEITGEGKDPPKEEPSKEKRVPSVAPPRPNTAGAKPPAFVKTLRPNFGPAIPAAPRLPSEVAAKPAMAPRPVGVVRAPAAPAKPLHPAPAPRGPSTSAIDKDWSINDDETTNTPEKSPAIARPAPPVETAARDVPSPRDAQPIAQPSRGSVVRTAPPPSPHDERRPTDESTESTTYQFAKNTLSLRPGRMPSTQNRNEQDVEAPDDTRPLDRPPGLMESYGNSQVKQPDEAPPTAPSADLERISDIPAYAGTTARLESLGLIAPHLPAPPKVREPTATTMLPVDFQHDVEDDDQAKRPHEVSRTIRLAADFLAKVLPPGRMPKGLLLQLQPPPLPPPSATNGDAPQFVRLPAGTPHAATSHALRAVKPPAPEAPPQLPMNAILMSGATLITMVIGAFFVGRCSVKPSANNGSDARTGVANIARAIQEKLPGPPKPCWVVKQPARWAPVVSKDVPFELLVQASGKVAVGYAKSDDEAVGFEVTPASGQVEEEFVDKAKSEIARVSPMGKTFFISTVEPPGSLRSLAVVNADKPFYLGISDKHLAWADQPSGVANRLWPVNDDLSGNIRVSRLGDRGFVAALRAGSSRQKKVYAALIGPDRKPVTNLVNVAGSGGSAGEAMVGSNGREVAIVFGDQAGEQSPSKLRIGHAPIGKIPATTTVFEAPAGGPGGDANHPSIGGLADGRWVLVWTEGSSSSKSVRAQTFSSTFTAVGDPILLSPPSSNYGASMVGVVGNYVTVVFVQKGKSNNELWGSILQCG